MLTDAERRLAGARAAAALRPGDRVGHRLPNGKIRYLTYRSIRLGAVCGTHTTCLPWDIVKVNGEGVDFAKSSHVPPARRLSPYAVIVCYTPLAVATHDVIEVQASSASGAEDAAKKVVQDRSPGAKMTECRATPMPRR